MARRTDIPPYEIMRRRSAEKVAAQGSSVPQGPAAAPAPAARSAPGTSPWWVGATVPIVLRVSRGLAVLAGVGLLLLVILAYWVGATRGRSAAEQQYASQNADSSATGGPRGVGHISISRPPEGGGSADTAAEADPADPEADLIQTTYEERRERGLNYFQLVTTSREEGEQIAVFLARARIDTQLVLIDNDRLCIVYAVERGFRGDELNSDARKQHESYLRALGNQWKELGSSHSNFDTMIPARYAGSGSD